METIESFCDRHGACADGKKWVSENCSTMNDVWECAKPSWLIWVATRPGVVDDKTLRLFACWCVRQVWHLLEERSRNAILVAEKFANGEATEDELAAARHAASDVAWDFAGIERSAAGEAAWAALDAADYATASAAKSAALVAHTVTQSVAMSAEWASAWASARAAAQEDQAKWLRENAKPNFEVVLKKSEAVK